MVEAKAIFDMSTNVKAMAGAFDRKQGMVGEIETLVVQIIVGAAEATPKMKDGRARPRNQPGVKQKVLMAQKPKQSFPGVIALKEVILVIGVTKVISKVMDGEIKPQIHLGVSTNVPLAHKTKQTVSRVMALKEVTLVRHCYILIQYLAATWKKGLFLDKVDRLRNFFWSDLGRGHKNAISLS